MAKPSPMPLPPLVLSEDLLDTPRRADRLGLSWVGKPSPRRTPPDVGT